MAYLECGSFTVGLMKNTQIDDKVIMNSIGEGDYSLRRSNTTKDVDSHRECTVVLDLNRSIVDESKPGDMTEKAKRISKVKRAPEVQSSTIDLSLNLSPPRANHSTNDFSNPSVLSPLSLSSPTSSPRSSCMSSDFDANDIVRNINRYNAISKVVMGCTRCLMYVMVSEIEPQCPKCKSCVLLDIFRGRAFKKLRKC